MQKKYIIDVLYIDSVGTSEQWKAINFNQGNNSLTGSSATVHYNSAVP